MTMMMAKATNKPLLLKDFLELDSNSDSFRLPDSRTSVRFLLDTELGPAPAPATSRSPSLSRISSAIAAVRRFSFSPSPSDRSDGILSRSFSKKLRRSLWRKRRGEEEVRETSPGSWGKTVRDIVRLRSFGDDVDARLSPFDYPSPVVSTCSCSSGWSDADGAASDFSEIDTGSSSSNPNPNPRCECAADDGDSPVTAARHRKAKGNSSEEAKGSECQSEEEKEQLSPVGVMDFPYEDEDDEEEEQHDATLLCFQRTLADIEKSKHHLPQKKTKRHECLTELDPVNLDKHFASTKDDRDSNLEVKHGKDVPAEDQRARDLLENFKSSFFSELQGWDTEKVLLDFFIQGMSSFQNNGASNRSNYRLLWNSAHANVEGPRSLLKEASDCIRSSYMMRKEMKDHHGEILLKDMDKKGCWTCLDEEEEELVGIMGDFVLGRLLSELVVDLISC